MGESGWAQKTAGARKIRRKALLSVPLKPDQQSINAFGGESSFAERIVALHISAWPWPRLRKFGENIMLCPCNNPSLQSLLLCPYRKTGCGKYQLNCASRKVPHVWTCISERAATGWYFWSSQNYCNLLYYFRGGGKTLNMFLKISGRKLPGCTPWLRAWRRVIRLLV